MVTPRKTKETIPNIPEGILDMRGPKTLEVLAKFNVSGLRRANEAPKRANETLTKHKMGLTRR